MKCGGFEINKSLTGCDMPDEVRTAFEEVYGKRLGWDIVPVLYCGKQIVSGVNYMIICKASPVILHRELATSLVKVVIHAPLPNNANDSYYEVSRETLIGSPAANDSVSTENPYVEYPYVFEAEYAAGMNIFVPAQIHNDQLEHIYVIGGEVAELDYKNGLCLRESKGIEDISGHYESYPEVKQFTVSVPMPIGECRVVAKGREADKYSVILWQNGKRSFSIYAPNGMSEAEIGDFIASLRVVN